MYIVGVDFGTTNVRISTWDPGGDRLPQPVTIGSGADGTTAMPAVVALRRLPGGKVSVIVGEEADSEIDDPNDTVVIRNIKRYAVSNDGYVSEHLELANAHEVTPKWPPVWWNPKKHCVEAWGRQFPVWDLIGSILAEAFRRADVGDVFEWRAGCPVHAGLDYREQLTRTLSKITGSGDIDWIMLEPILFMNLIDRLGGVDGARIKGSYLVYDFGGGSFDCALVEIGGDGGRMIVYGADGHPLLGGADIDRALVDRFTYSGQPDLLRKAKERLGPGHRSETLADGTVITLDDIESTLTEGKFVDRSLNSMRDTYMGAKVLWKRGEGEDDPPIGEVLTRDSETGLVRFVREINWDDMVRDVDGIILFGGPTKSPHFRENLSAQFEDRMRIWEASELVGIEGLELVGVSMGACYSSEESYSPLHVNRLPVRVTLANLHSGDSVEYEPFKSLTRNFSPFDDFVSEQLPEQPALVELGTYGKTIQLTMATPTGDIVNRAFIDSDIDSRLSEHTLKLVIDRLGRVGVEQASGRMSPKRFMIFDDTPWQTSRQRLALQRLLEQQREYERRQGDRTSFYVNRRPWDYPTP